LPETKPFQERLGGRIALVAELGRVHTIQTISG
jgi:hypothetical protein